MKNCNRKKQKGMSAKKYLEDLEEVQNELISLYNGKTIADPAGRPPFEVEYAIKRLDVVIERLRGL